jgi:hypothetical protein
VGRWTILVELRRHPGVGVGGGAHLLEVAGKVVLAREAPLRLLLLRSVGHPLKPHAETPPGSCVRLVMRRGRGASRDSTRWADPPTLSSVPDLERRTSEMQPSMGLQSHLRFGMLCMLYAMPGMLPAASPQRLIRKTLPPIILPLDRW